MATIFILFVFLSSSAGAMVSGNAVDVSIVTDDGTILPTYHAKTRHDVKKFYAEAGKGDHYRIEVRNRLNRRVGLVIAVDGRNIISGSKSWLKNNERMYILEPYGFGEYSGWRTAQDRINRFYFTDVPESYAAAFGDESAMGIIAVAVYPEVRHCKPSISRFWPSLGANEEMKSAGTADKSAARDEAPSSSMRESKGRQSEPEQKLESAGTGYGRDEYSPSRIVAFEPERRAVETICVKYEWRSTLCKLGVIACERPPRQAPNRLWDDYGYAPPPPAKVRR
ncbi:MAG: hypothetical protein JW943_05560 [Deltaproteobacteria bacterium]|nr:hypothetical protein [Deltaproteobacteria bacterium]